ncbi:hypothetical protein Tco_0642347 [Tanacetum coccineum]
MSTMSTMAENVIAAGSENRSPMLERVEGSELSPQERESKLYNKFDKFTSEKVSHALLVKLNPTVPKYVVVTKRAGPTEKEWAEPADRSQAEAKMAGLVGLVEPTAIQNLVGWKMPKQNGLEHTEPNVV